MDKHQKETDLTENRSPREPSLIRIRINCLNSVSTTKELLTREVSSLDRARDGTNRTSHVMLINKTI